VSKYIYFSEEYYGSEGVSFMQVIPLGTHWIHMWSFLQPDEEHKAMDFGCNHLHTVARDLYSQFGWHATRRLT
jgi:hypothetical protein